MAERAAHPVDHVLPAVPMRQWVLSLPFRLGLLRAPRTPRRDPRSAPAYEQLAAALDQLGRLGEVVALRT